MICSVLVLNRLYFITESSEIVCLNNPFSSHVNREYNFAIVLLPAPCSPMNKVHFLNSTYADCNGPTFLISRVVISFIVLTDVIDIITNLMVCQCKDCANREQNIKLA